MGIDICLVGEVPKGFLGKRHPDRAIEAIKTWFETESPLLLLGKFLTETGIAVQLHPAAEPIRFSSDGDRIIFEARTNSVGPGYHAAVIEIATLLASATQITWLRTEESYDEGDYFLTRDFQLLRQKFAAWLQATCRAVLDQARDEKGGLQICAPIGKRITFPGYVLTPQGPRDRAWVEAVASGASDGADFYAWPEAGLPASYWLGLALAFMWSETTWPPQSDRDRSMMGAAHQSLLEAFRQYPKNPRIPWQSWAELAGHAGQQLPVGAPSPLPEGEPIGYFRGA